MFYMTARIKLCQVHSQILNVGLDVTCSPTAPIQARITSRDQLYPAGVDVTLQCQAKGYQTPGIIWYKNFEAIVESEKYLRKGM